MIERERVADVDPRLLRIVIAAVAAVFVLLVFATAVAPILW